MMENNYWNAKMDIDDDDNVWKELDHNVWKNRDDII